MMRRLFGFSRRSARTIRADVDDELRFHIDSRVEALIARGTEPAEARRLAEREFGDVDEARRYIGAIDRRTEADIRRRDYLGELRQDLGYALRQLRSAPAFTITALLTLALGIGANTAIFSVVRGVLLRPLPFPKPEQLVQVWSANPAADNLQSAVSVLDLEDWRVPRRAIADIGGWFYQADGGSGIDLTGAGEPQRLGAVFMTPGFLPALGVAAEQGRLPREDEMTRGGDDHVVVLSHAFWVRQFGAQAAVIGSTITLSGGPYRVLGVMPASFRFPAEQVDVYVPYSSIPDDAIPHIRPVRVLEVVARVADGHTVADARTELNVIAARLAQQYPEDAAYTGTTLVGLHEAMTGKARTGLLVLLGAVAFVLLMVCVNVASLQLARGAVREREIAVRAALGAGRGRIIRQLLTESVVLSLLGGIGGIALATLGVRALLGLSAGQLPRSGDVRLDGVVLGFALLLSAVTGLLFGLVPALRVSATRLQGTLREGVRGIAGAAGQKLRNSLVVAEVALAVVLVVGAGLMVRSFVALTQVDPGFRPDHLVAINFTISTSRHENTYTQYYHDVIDRARELPGVVSAAAAKNVPFRGNGELWSFTTPGMVLRAGEQPPNAMVLHISDGYFKTIGAAVLAGREFTPQDVRTSPTVVVINETMAKRYYPGGVAAGKTLRIGGPTGNPVQVVGVVHDIRQTAMDAPPLPTMYIDNMQNSRVKMTLVVRTQGDPLAMARRIREMIWTLDKDQAITSIFTFNDVVGEALARPRLLTVLLGVFGASGLLLGALGIYGLLAYLVNQRQREIGVRIALGADTASVLRMIVRHGVSLAVAGVVIGLAGALALTRVMRGVLYSVGPDDPWTFAGVAVALVGIAALASWLPARRAAGVDPAVALREY